MPIVVHILTVEFMAFQYSKYVLSRKAQALL